MGSAAPDAGVRAIMDISRAVSVDPQSHAVGASDWAAGRRRSKVWPQARQRYSYIGMGDRVRQRHER